MDCKNCTKVQKKDCNYWHNGECSLEVVESIRKTFKEKVKPALDKWEEYAGLKTIE